MIEKETFNSHTNIRLRIQLYKSLFNQMNTHRYMRKAYDP